jgi:UDP-N-acetyl-D-glucosamine dehydrogenase
MNKPFEPLAFAGLSAKISARTAVTGVIGLGYVGLPLAVACAAKGYPTIGFDVAADKVGDLNAGRSYIDAVPSGTLENLVQAGRFTATASFSQLGACDVIVICVPTPLSAHREPDLGFVVSTAETIAAHLRQGQLVVLESTTFPGTTREIVKPILEATGLRSGIDFFLGFSPEREDPGNRDFSTVSIPKIVAGDGPGAMSAIETFYAAVVNNVVTVSSVDVAEATKITENVFRAVNIALVNELKIVFDQMGIDVWEVIEAAKTKPFGFMPFYPGPGLGGHCIPIDPFYLTWKSIEYGVPTRFIELAGEINAGMPRYVLGKLEEALDRRHGISLSTAKILILGLAYKKNVSDIRESPALRIIDVLEKRGAHVDYHDPHVAIIPPTREHAPLAGRRSVPLCAETLSQYDAAVVVTDHEAVDYALVGSETRLVVDTRNVFAKAGLAGSNIVKA